MNKALEHINLVPCNPANYGGDRTADEIKYLIFHYTGNDGDSDQNNVRYYRDTVVKASAHYFVDDDSITQSVPDLRVAWAIGGDKYASCAETGGGKMHGIIRNYNSISIEMCDTQRDGTYNVTEATLENAVALGRLLMERYHIPVENVYRHFDITGKLCPRYFVDNNKWAAFKVRLAQAEGTMNQEQFNEMFKAAMANYRAEQSKQSAASWAAAGLERIKKLIGSDGNPVTDGTRPADYITRQEVTTMLDRFATALGLYKG